MNRWKVAWESARKAAKVSCRFHDLRHMFISRLAESQASDSTIKIPKLMFSMQPIDNSVKHTWSAAMKILPLATIFLIGYEVADAQISGSAQSTQQPFSLALIAPQRALGTNGKVVAKVVLTNTSDKNIIVLQCGFTDYTVEVTGSGGAKVPETELGRRLNGKSLGLVCMSTRTVLKPNQAVTDEIAINDLYRLDSRGQYVVRVRREIPDWMGRNGTVESNSVTVNVTPQGSNP